MVAVDVMAGIVSFNPDLERLCENVAAIAPQVSRVVIFDNGSDNADEVTALARRWENVEVLLHPRDGVIAFALNRLIDVAHDQGSRFILTLDQDSVATSGMVETPYYGFTSSEVGIVTPLIVDRNKREKAMTYASLPEFQEYTHAAWRGALTSGSLLSVPAARQVGQFDERLFIDYVDYDLNARLMLAGFSILRANRVTLLHEVGNARPTWLRVPRRTLAGSWHLERFYSFGHSPTRCYYKARNRVIFTKKFAHHFGVTHEGIWQIPQQIVLTVLFEDQKRAKLAAFLRGVYDGIRFRLNANEDVGAAVPEKRRAT